MTARKPHRRTAHAWFAVLLLPSLAAAQTGLEPRWRAAKPAAATIHAGQDPTRLVVKLQDDARATVFADRLQPAPAGADTTSVANLADALEARVSRLIPLADEELERMRRDGERTSRRELADLTQYFTLELPPDTGPAEAAAILDALLAMDAVEEAYAAPRPAPSPWFGGTPTPDYEGTQSYRGAAPLGIDADHAETVPGGDGAHITVADIEYGWNLAGLFGSTNGHEDLTGVSAQRTPAPIGATSTWVLPPAGSPNLELQHGTAVAGLLAADANGSGIEGLARGTTVRVSALNTTAGYNPAAAILRAASRLQAGDVILLEAQAFGPNHDGTPGSQFGMVPVELYSAEFNAIQAATARCIHVIEAAGNGSQNLDDYTSGSPGSAVGHPWYALFHTAVRDSGAVMVGAAYANTSHGRMPWSNYGFRVDTFSWGENIVTLGYGDLFDGGGPTLDPDRLYTQVFGGTSGASAIIASAAASITGVHRVRQRRTPMQPWALRWFLRTSGTLPLHPSSHSGRQPDLASQFPILSQGRDPAVVLDGYVSSTFGSSVASIGDANGDGFEDLAVGAPQVTVSPGPITFAGLVQVISGIDGSRLYPNPSAVPGIFGTQTFELLGASVSGLGDVNGDGYDDFLAGAPGAGGGAGEVRAYSGATGTVLYTVVGPANGALGSALRSAGDVDGDGFPDFIAGAYGDPVAGNLSGSARVYSGLTGAPLYTFNGGAAGEYYGVAVDGAGDVNGDGRGDVIVGSWADRVDVWSGLNGSLLYTRSGDAAGDRFGAGVAGVGDVDADGYDDFAVGATRDDDAGTDAGSVKVYSGLTGALVHRLDGLAAGDAFGATVTGLGDVNADGYDDFACGAPQSDVAGTDSGAAWTVSGRTGTPIWGYRGQDSGDHFGSAIASAGDRNGDGLPDVAIGAPFWASIASGMGRVIVFLAPPTKVLRAHPQQ